jgi:hypothetical protein
LLLAVDAYSGKKICEFFRSCLRYKKTAAKNKLARKKIKNELLY